MSSMGNFAAWNALLLGEAPSKFRGGAAWGYGAVLRLRVGAGSLWEGILRHGRLDLAGA